MQVDDVPAAQFRFLGAFEVVAGGRPVDVGTGKQRLLLAILALERGRPVAVDTLAEELWGPRPQVDVASGLQNLVSKLRRALAPAGAAVAAREIGRAHV